MKDKSGSKKLAKTKELLKSVCSFAYDLTKALLIKLILRLIFGL